MKFFLFILLCLSAHAAEVYRVAPSGSMKPIFDERYVIYVERKEWKDIKVGDIILYRHVLPYIFEGIAYYTTCHKVWQKSSGGSVVLCWGVNNTVPDDELITESMYVGTVVKWETLEEYFK